MMLDDQGKLKSRKFILTVMQWVILMVLPIVYKQFMIADEILITVLTASSSIVAVYTGFNVLQKKIEG